MTTSLRRYVATATRIDGKSWPERARTCRDNYDQCYRVVDSTVLAERASAVTLDGILRPAYAADPVERALFQSTSATIYVRSTNTTTYVVALVSPWDASRREYAGSMEVYYGNAGGGGYDRLAAAAAGIPIGTALAPDGERHRVITTDHSGAFTLDHPWRVEGERGPGEFLIHRSGYLPNGLFVI